MGDIRSIVLSVPVICGMHRTGAGPWVLHVGCPLLLKERLTTENESQSVVLSMIARVSP